MKIILNEKQIKNLSSLKEQNPDNEEMLAIEPLVVNYKNLATDNFRIYFNKVSDVSKEDIENNEQIILRGDGQEDIIINTNLLSFKYWESQFGPNLSISKKEGIEITPEEIPLEDDSIKKLLYNNTFLYTEVGVPSNRKGPSRKQLNRLLKMFGVIQLTGGLGMFRMVVVESLE